MDVNKFVNTTRREVAGESRGDQPDIFTQAHSARIALYSDRPSAPEVFEISSHTPGRFLEQLSERTFRLAKDQGGTIPLPVVREVVDNLVHAEFANVTISVMEAGCLIRVSDRGAGIVDKKKALERGYTTAADNHRALIRGVGSGLFAARRLLDDSGGSLEIDDNLGGGTVVTISSPRVPAKQPPAGDKKKENFSLSKRQKKVFFIIIEIGAVGPSRIAAELSVGLSTVYRDLGALEAAGLIKTGKNGKRSLTEKGLGCVDMIISC